MNILFVDPIVAQGTDQAKTSTVDLFHFKCPLEPLCVLANLGSRRLSLLKEEERRAFEDERFGLAGALRISDHATLDRVPLLDERTQPR